jgi:hypothetical protein
MPLQLPHPGGLTARAQDRNSRELDFAANVEAQIAVHLNPHISILERLANTLDAIRPRDTPVVVKNLVLVAAAAPAPVTSLEIVLPDGIPWLLAQVAFFGDPNATGKHSVTLSGLMDVPILVQFNVGDYAARIEPYLPVARSMTIRASDDNVATAAGNIVVMLRFEPARW